MTGGGGVATPGTRQNFWNFPLMRPLPLPEVMGTIKQNFTQPPELKLPLLPDSKTLHFSFIVVKRVHVDDKGRAQEETIKPAQGQSFAFFDVPETSEAVGERMPNEEQEESPEEEAEYEEEVLPDIDEVPEENMQEDVDSESELTAQPPGAAEAAAAASQVRSMAAEQLKAAWEKLRDEFKVQLLVWDDMVLIRAAGYPLGGNLQDNDKIRSLVESALEMISASDDADISLKAAETLQQALRIDDEAGGLLNNSSKANSHAVLEAQQITTSRLELAACLDAAINETPEACYLPTASPEANQHQPEKQNLDALIGACNLTDLGLVYRVRRVLGLCMGRLHATDTDVVEVEPPAVGSTTQVRGGTLEDLTSAHCGSVASGGSGQSWRQRVRPLFRTHRKKSNGYSSRSSKSSKSSNNSSRSSRRDNIALEADLMPATPSKNCQFKGTPPQGTESGTLGMPGPPDVAPWITETASTGSVEAYAAAEKVRGLASEGLVEIWDQLREQWKVQVLVWNSLALLHGSSSGPCKAFLEDFEAALQRADGDAATELDNLLHEDSKLTNGGHLSNSTQATIKCIVEAERFANIRRELANSLEAAGRAGDAWEPGQVLDARVEACKLEDLGLEYCVRRVLGLSCSDFRDRWKHYRHGKKSKLPKRSLVSWRAIRNPLQGVTLSATPEQRLGVRRKL